MVDLLVFVLETCYEYEHLHRTVGNGIILETYFSFTEVVVTLLGFVSFTVGIVSDIPLGIIGVFVLKNIISHTMGPDMSVFIETEILGITLRGKFSQVRVRLLVRGVRRTKLFRRCLCPSCVNRRPQVLLEMRTLWDLKRCCLLTRPRLKTNRSRRRKHDKVDTMCEELDSCVHGINNKRSYIF